MSLLDATQLPVIDDAFATLRQSGRDAFAAQGVPGPRTENWKYTSLAKWSDTAFAASPALAHTPDASVFAAVSALVIDIHNGQISLPTADLPKGLNAWTVDTCPAEILAHLGSIANPADKPMAAVNLASFQDVLVLRVKRGAAIDGPVLLDIVGDNDRDGYSLHHPRLLMLVEDGASVTLIEHHRGNGQYYSNPVSEISLGRDANMRHYKIQDESADALHTAVCAMETGENAQYEGFILQQGASLARHEIHQRVNGKHLNAQINGACLGSGKQHLDLVTYVDIAATDCDINELYKTVLDDQAKSAFWGKFLVRPDSQKTDARMLCNNLLLNQGAEADAKPELEIYADDVQCAHGATTGQMNMNALFFLRQRGISEEEARAMLTRGFIIEAVDKISHEAVREIVSTMIPGAAD